MTMSQSFCYIPRGGVTKKNAKKLRKFLIRVNPPPPPPRTMLRFINFRNFGEKKKCPSSNLLRTVGDTLRETYKRT